jgi:cysteine desulfuration protein SufE
MMTLDELYEEFDFLVDWEDRCDFLIDLGFELPALPDEEHVEANRVHGCQSNVWMTTELSGEPPRLQITADSDSVIVRGLIAVLLMIYGNKTPQEVVDIDARPIFAKLSLDRHLSPQRKNGLGGMVERIRSFAREHVST